MAEPATDVAGTADELRLATSFRSSHVLARMRTSMSRQRARTVACPASPRLDGKLAVVTGATGGMGVHIARGLATRGAALIVPCRNEEKGARVADELRRETPAASVELVEADLEDLASVASAAQRIVELSGGRTIDILVENAGIWPQRYATTRQGHEVAFGVNVLAHFALRRRLLEAGRLDGGRVVSVTGDIYVVAETCTSDYRWRGPLGGMHAYCRSKLGNLWIASELARRRPDLCVYAVHPGVVATSLGGEGGAIGRRVRSALLIPPQLGAQMALICATQEGLANGGYYHNTGGLMRLASDDPARDAAGAAALWETCERLTAAA